MDKLIYLRLSVLQFISKITLYEYRYDYIKTKYEDNAKLIYMDTDSFLQIVFHVKTEDIYADIAQHVETRFNTSNNDIQRESKKVKTKK